MESELIEVGELRLDLRNPRMPDTLFESELDAIRYLVEHADVGELVQSIGTSGWLDFEPLIATRDDNVVIEGNRRLAAIRLLGEPELRNEVGYRLPSNLDHEPPKSVRVFYVDNRSDARDFIGFKHINGAFKWDSFAKAKYAVDWLDEESDLTVRQISERLGDSHNTILRLVNAYRVLRQAEALGFSLDDITAKRGFSFSHLYTALPSPSVREFLGIVADGATTLDNSPVDDEHAEALLQYMTWLYGQRGRGNEVIVSQNPDLGRLTKVLSSRQATAMLQATASLDEAYDLVEDKGEAFANSIYNLLKIARETLSLVGNYDGDPEIATVTATVFRTVRTIYRGIQDRDSDDSDENAE